MFGAPLCDDLRRTKRAVALVLEFCAVFLYHNSLNEEVSVVEVIVSLEYYWCAVVFQKCGSFIVAKESNQLLLL